MKKLETQIKAFELEDVKNALRSLDVDEIIVSDIRRYDHAPTRKEIYRGAEYEIDHVTAIKLELILEDNLVEPAAKILRDHCADAQLRLMDVLLLCEAGPVGDERPDERTFRLAS